MSGILWRGPDGIERVLTDPAPLRATIAEAVLNLKLNETAFRSGDPATVAQAMTETRGLRDQLAGWIKVAGRWDAHAARETGRVAEEILATLPGIAADATRISLIHRCYDQWREMLSAERMGRTPEHSRDAAASVEQLSLITTVVDAAVRPAVIGGLTFEQAHAVMTANPATNREAIPPAVAAFAWIDPGGHAHQVRSLEVIESAFFTAARELEALAPALRARDDIVALEQAVAAAIKQNATIVALHEAMRGYERHVDDKVRQFGREFADWLETITI